jgi:hypothetical protein
MDDGSQSGWLSGWWGVGDAAYSHSRLVWAEQPKKNQARLEESSIAERTGREKRYKCSVVQRTQNRDGSSII